MSRPTRLSAVLSADGLGDFASSMWALGEGPNMRALGEVTFPHSLGMFYTALTQYLGFWKFGDEYKVMGLAAYGQPVYMDEFRRIVRADGPLSFRLGLEYFTHQSQGADMTWRDAGSTPVLGRLFSTHLEKRLGPARKADEPLEQKHHDLAASMQAALEEVIIAHWNALAKKTSQKSLCLAGGIAFNCVANGKIFDHTPFERVYVQPAAGDAGLSVGAAFAVNHQIEKRPREFAMEHAYWGPSYSARGDSPRRRPVRSRRRGSRNQGVGRAILASDDCRAYFVREDRGLVSRRHGMGAARARQSQHSGRSAAGRK